MFMKIRCLFLICVAIIPFYACFGQNKEIEVHLSLVDGYLKMELTNHTHEDLYIPHMYWFYAIWDKNGVEVTTAYQSHLVYATPDFRGSHPYFGPPPEEFRDDNYDVQQRIYRNEALEKEKAIFLKLNPSVTEKKIRKKQKFDFDQFLELFYVTRKYDGVAIKARQTLHVFMPVFGLLDTEKCLSIRFARKNDWEYSLFDTVKYDGYRIYTPFPEVNAGYRLYHGAIACEDVITLNL